MFNIAIIERHFNLAELYPFIVFIMHAAVRGGKIEDEFVNRSRHAISSRNKAENGAFLFLFARVRRHSHYEPLKRRLTRDLYCRQAFVGRRFRCFELVQSYECFQR